MTFTLRVVLAFLLLVSSASGAPASTAAQTDTDSTASERTDWPTDGWRTSTPEEQGMDGALLDEAGRRVPAELPDVSALLVVRHGRLVFERYYGGVRPDDPINVRSVTKSVTSALIGIALAEGDLDGLDQPIGELIPDRIPPEADPLTPSITLEQLLTMTSGLAWDAGSDYQRLIASDDWVDLTLGLPVAYEPGTVFAYNSGGSHLLSVILAEATGQETSTYAQTHLFDPLGIEPGDWDRSPQGETNGGFGLELTVRDMAKLGELYLNGGRWEGEQIIPTDYVRASTTVQSAGDATGGTPYGYQWWVTDATGYPAFYALGYGGQYIYVVPDLDLVVVVAAARRVPAEELRSPRYLIENVIVPAAVNP